MPVTSHDLEKLGYKLQSDGSYAKPESANSPASQRVSEPKSKPPSRSALDHNEKGEKESRGRFIVRITRKAVSLLDADNFHGGCKPLIDQLRYHGLISNDDPASAEFIFIQQKVHSRAEQGMIVEILK